jgi:hypothetical protein
MQVVTAMRETQCGNGTAPLYCSSREHFQKDVLGEVFLGHPAGQVGANDADDQRVEVVDQGTRRGLIALTHEVQAAGQIERLVFRHRRMWANSGTTRKTGPARRGYRREGHS